MIFVSKSKKVIFIHIPKTGGTAIRNLFPDAIRDNYHAPASFASELVEDPKDYFMFTIVRNPFYRLISLYRHDYIRALDWPPERFQEKFGVRKLRLSPLGSLVKWLQYDHPFFLRQSDFIDRDCHIYYYEDFDYILMDLMDRFDLDGEIHKNNSTNYLGEYDPDVWATEKGINYIKTHCKEDFHRFGYRPAYEMNG